MFKVRSSQFPNTTLNSEYTGSWCELYIGEVASVLISSQHEKYWSNNVIVLFDLSQPHLKIVIRSIDEYFAPGVFVGFDFKIFCFFPG